VKAVAIIFATIVRVIDGDTVRVDLPDCNVDLVCKNIEVRFAGIDTPELHSKCPAEKERALKAKAMVEQAFPKGTQFVLADPKKDKYFRILAFAPVVSKQLLDAGLAIPYGGEKKIYDWCKL